MQRLLLVVAPATKTSAILKAVTSSQAQHMVTGAENHLEGEEDRCAVWISVEPDKHQNLMDKLQAVLGQKRNWRLFVLPVEATLPLPEKDEEPSSKPISTSREELFTTVEAGASIGRNYILLVILSTIVAAIGLMKNNVAAIIGAMVIAPLLGPNLAMILGAALGDKDLIFRAAKTLMVGLSIAVAIAFGLGATLGVDLTSTELMSRTDIGPDAVVLALASGAAAALSLISGLSTTLVGVMVAVALLPPLSAFGLLLGAGEFPYAMGAFTLFAVNVVCVGLSGQLVFWSRDVQPRSGWARKTAQQSFITMMIFWMISLLILAMIMTYYNRLIAAS